MSCKTIEGGYAVKRMVPPSAEIEARIEHVLSIGSVGTRASRCLNWRGWARG
jgi:hypothetical protein